MNQEVNKLKRQRLLLLQPLCCRSTRSNAAASRKHNCRVSRSAGVGGSAPTVLAACSLRKMYRHSLGLGASFLLGRRKMMRVHKNTKHAAGLFHS